MSSAIRLICLATLSLFLTATSAFASDLSGHYKIIVRCALGNGWGELDIAGKGANYTISGSSRGGTYSGQIRGGVLRMTFVGSGNQAEFTASTVTPGNLAGTLTQKSSFGGTCTWMATRSQSAGGDNNIASKDADNSDVCGLTLGKKNEACASSNEKCACITFRNNCPYPVNVTARVSRLKRLQADSVYGGKTGKICATGDSSQQVEYMGWKPWPGYPKKGQPRPKGN